MLDVLAGVKSVFARVTRAGSGLAVGARSRFVAISGAAPALPMTGTLGGASRAAPTIPMRARYEPLDRLSALPKRRRGGVGWKLGRAAAARTERRGMC